MSTQVNTEQIVKDLKAVARDGEDLVKVAAGEVSEKARNARVRLATAMESGKEKAIEGAKATDKVVHEHPYASIGIAFAVGVMLGVLLARR